MLLLLGCSSSKKHLELDGLDIFSFRNSYSNSHVIKVGPEAFIMVDSGGLDDAPKLEQDMRELGVDPSQLKAIILTHGHWDHASGAKYFQKKYKTPVIVGEGDRQLLMQGKSDPLCPTDFFAKQRLKSDQDHTFDPPEITRTVSEVTTLPFGIELASARLVPLPSHTEGSLALVVGKVAFVGDLFRGSIVSNDATLHFYICDIAKNRLVIQNFLKKEAVDVEYFFPGHFGPVLSRESVLSEFQGK